MSPTATSTEEFEAHRRGLRGLAYRMLGSIAEAEDVVQEAWLRWREVDRRSVAHTHAFLTQTVARLCLDQLKSARTRRETYVGPWLPEPLVEDHGLFAPGPEAAAELASDLSYAFFMALERLSPTERAVFLLHDVFDEDFAAIASVLDRSEAACRQLATRARGKVRDGKSKFTVSHEESERVAKAFLNAAQTGDLDAIRSLLAVDARLTSDGGGRVAAAGVPIIGRDRVAKFLWGIRSKYPLPHDVRVRMARVNGLFGCVVSFADGKPLQTVAVEVTENGQVGAIYIVRNPDKLSHLRNDRAVC